MIERGEEGEEDSDINIKRSNHLHIRVHPMDVFRNCFKWTKIRA